MQVSPIGIVHSTFCEPEGTPIQAAAAIGSKAIIEVYDEYMEGLKDIDGFSHLILLYHFHQVKKARLIVKPFLDDHTHGIFATRSPARPNPIGFSVVRLKMVDENLLYVEDVDILDQTPVLDIKPYIGEFDHRITEKIGWFQKSIHKMHAVKDDGRFKG